MILTAATLMKATIDVEKIAQFRAAYVPLFSPL